MLVQDISIFLILCIDMKTRMPIAKNAHRFINQAHNLIISYIVAYRSNFISPSL